MNEQAYFLLDTCAMVQIAGPEPLQADTAQTVEQAANSGRLRVSPISAWEIGMAVAHGRINTTLTALRYFNTFMERTGSQLCVLDPEVLIQSISLPGDFHKDPMDRILVATARHYGFTLVTSDRAILAYGRQGHVKTLAC
jgi:PIN domain nuclease of toxin-antitoxin system